MIEDPWTYIFASVGALGSATTAAALFFIWRQSKQTDKQIRLTQDELENKLRPWLGVSAMTINENGYLQIDVKNTGSMPAKIVRTQQVFSSKVINQEQLRSRTDFKSKVVIFPDSTRVIGLPQTSLEGRPYVGVLIQYEYSKNKNGEIGVILKYNDLRNRFDFLEEFVY